MAFVFRLLSGIFLALGSLLLLSACDSPFWGPLRTHQGTMKIINDSDEAIVKGSMTLCDKKVGFDNLAPHASRTFVYRITCFGDFNVKATFSSGRELVATTGYVTSECDFVNEFLVRPDGFKWGPQQTHCG